MHLIGVGFDSLDFGSFVSPKAIPQMADTKQVIANIDPGRFQNQTAGYRSKYTGRGRCSIYPAIRDIGFPFSISETFQQRNTNSSILKSVKPFRLFRKFAV